MAIDLNSLQAQVIALLKTLGTSCVDRWYDEPVVNPTYPFGEVAGSLNLDEDSTSSDGIQHELMLNVWSEWKGFKQLNAIFFIVRPALHHRVFTAGTANCILFADSYQPIDGADGVTRQGIIHIRCMCRT